MSKIWHGRSRLTGAPISVYLACATTTSQNPKTGDMAQVYILADRQNPVSAQASGHDRAVCGDCPLRPVRGRIPRQTCYVVAAHAPMTLWKSRHAAPRPHRTPITKPIRLGAYGDPAAVPIGVWHRLLAKARGWTAYTHQWRRVPSLRRIAMASVESLADAHAAHARGWRTFRILADGERPAANEVLCPASKEAGRRTTCRRCLLCRGGLDRRVKHVAIYAH